MQLKCNVLQYGNGVTTALSFSP